MNLLDTTQHFIKRYRISIFLSSLISALFFTIGAVPEILYFNQEAISNGELWRLFTAHIVHSDLEHLTWNLCALLILSLLIERDNRLLLFISLLAGIVSIDYYLWVNSIGIINYAGFSGVLNTLLVIVLFQQNQKYSGQLFFQLLLIVIYVSSFLKILIEIHTQQAIFSHINWQAAPQVHLIGFMAGTILVAFILFIKKNKGIEFNRPNLLHNNG
ncbi:MAG: rhombosortase [Gammaproteobacteria bacterium]|nr:rhombosortase [Gammaproteobacteria bacterium]